jgi:hypothetical protein
MPSCGQQRLNKVDEAPLYGAKFMRQQFNVILGDTISEG